MNAHFEHYGLLVIKPNLIAIVVLVLNLILIDNLLVLVLILANFTHSRGPIIAPIRQILIFKAFKILF